MRFLWLACTATEPSLQGDGSLESCAAIPLEGHAITCRVQVAADAGARGDDELARAACGEIAEGTWRDECHFRAGEELGRAGHTDRSLRHCAEAGRFSRNCVTHAAWGLPPDTALRSDGHAEVAAALSEFAQVAETALEGAPEGVGPEAMDQLMARVWFNLYVGSGVADPAPTKGLEPWQAAQARTAWAIEAARLRQGEDLAIAWAEGTVLRGEPLADRRNVTGRYASPVLPEEVQSHPHVATYGGGARLKVEDPETDLRIAVLEGLYFVEDTPPERFGAHEDDDIPEIRWTATKLSTLADPERQRSYEDPIQQEYARLAGQHRR
ncbi:MAG TPA: hypothetical protein QGF58_22885 [Myxococcota bacterium]|nr:hypothetical protein [Myxococcota bacterium]